MGKGGNPGTSTAAKEAPSVEPKPVWSSGVPFYPPSDRYWRIGGEWYDLEPFLDKHPGGGEILKMARDRFEDCTYAFEAHHHNYARARAIIAKYKVPTEKALATVRPQPAGRAASRAWMTIHGADLDETTHPKLLGDAAFYSVLRKRLAEHLKQAGCPGGGPTRGCVRLFWATFAAWAGAWLLTYWSGSLLAALLLGACASLLGAFGHNWVHQPRYKAWAYLSLDTIGFSSDGWFREHVLQHHMYTNTPWDNHFVGTDPFLVTDPTVARNWLQRNVMPFLNPLLLTFGLYANWFAHLVETAHGNERFVPTKLLLPLQIGLMVQRWGLLHGGALVYAANGVLGVWCVEPHRHPPHLGCSSSHAPHGKRTTTSHARLASPAARRYFSMALMNHNAEHTHDVDAHNAARDWGEAQLCASADWAVQTPFYRAGLYLRAPHGPKWA